MTFLWHVATSSWTSNYGEERPKCQRPAMAHLRGRTGGAGRQLSAPAPFTASDVLHPHTPPPLPSHRPGAGSGPTSPCYRAARTTEHMLQTSATPAPNPAFGTHTDPPCSPAQSYKPHSSLDWNRKNDGSKKGQKVRRHGVAVFGQAGVRTKGAGVPLPFASSYAVELYSAQVGWHARACGRL